MKHIRASAATIILFATPVLADSKSKEISKVEYGDRWPFTFEKGMLSCRPVGRLHIVTFTADGITCAVNGTAKGHKDGRGQRMWKDVDAIWRPNKEIPGTKVFIGPVIDAGRALCHN